MITPSLRLSLFLRSFLVQGSWNYRTLIGTGLGWALLPVSARLNPDEPKGLVPSDVDDPFNSHPYLTPLALGALARTAEEGADLERVRRFRDALRSPLGSLGDKLIWGAWRPLCLLGGILAAVLGVRPGVVIGTLLVAYNLPQVALRGGGLTVGLRLGFDVGGALERARLAQWSERVESAGVLVFGALLGLLLGKGLALSGLGFLWVWAGCVFLLGGILRGEALRRWAPVLLLLLIALGLVISPGAVGAG